MRNDYKLLATDLLPNSIMFDDREEDRGAAEAAGCCGSGGVASLL